MTMHMPHNRAIVDARACPKCGAEKGALCHFLTSGKVATFPHASRAGGTTYPIFPKHSAEVTSDRLAHAAEVWPDKFSGAELDMVGRIRHALQQIAQGDR